MSAYDKNDFLKRGAAMVALRSEVEQIADAVCAKGFDNIIMVGAGGTMWMPESFRYMLTQKTQIPCFLYWTQEITTADTCRLTDRSLVIFVSSSGREEVARSVEFCLSKGAQVVSFIGVTESRMADISTHWVYLNEKTGSFQKELPVILYFSVNFFNSSTVAPL